MTDNIHAIEIRVRPVTRYIVTKYEKQMADGVISSSCIGYGEFENLQHAKDVAFAIHYALNTRPEDDGGAPKGAIVKCNLDV